jgi:hypothetical protein
MRPALRFAAHATLLGLTIHFSGPPTALAQVNGQASASAAPPAQACPPAMLLWPHGAPGPPDRQPAIAQFRALPRSWWNTDWPAKPTRPTLWTRTS